MTRTLIIPAAGAGTRLGSPLPKLLVPVAGQPMIDRLLALYAPFVERVVVVVAPSAAQQVRQHFGGGAAEAGRITLVVQAEPTGMLDAILLARPEVLHSRAEAVWITWCDQVAVRAETLARLASEEQQHPDAALRLPTVLRDAPYIHFERDTAGEITRVLHRREGDAMPDTGEADLGLFALSRFAYLELLPRFAAELPRGTGTGERNFLPFIAWLKGRGVVRSVAATHWVESVGVNTPADLALVEAHLATLASSGPQPFR